MRRHRQPRAERRVLAGHARVQCARRRRARGDDYRWSGGVSAGDYYRRALRGRCHECGRATRVGLCLRGGRTAGGAAGSGRPGAALRGGWAAGARSQYPVGEGRLQAVNKAVSALEHTCVLCHCVLTSAPLGASACASSSSMICATLSISALSILCKPVHTGAKVRAHAAAARRHELFGSGRNSARRASRSTVCAETTSDINSEQCTHGYVPANFPRLQWHAAQLARCARRAHGRWTR